VKNELNRWFGYLALIFQAIIVVFAMIVFSSLVIDISDEIISGIIGFIGSIVGGVITYLGVKITLEHRDREVFLESYNREMAVISDVLENIRFIIGPEVFILRTVPEISETKEIKNKKLFEKLECFRDNFGKKLKKIRGNLDWEIVHQLEIRFKKFSALEAYKIQAMNGLKNPDDVIEEFFDVAQKIIGDLEAYREQLIQQYKKVKKKNYF
jgi:hypothetical protein